MNVESPCEIGDLITTTPIASLLSTSYKLVFGVGIFNNADHSKNKYRNAEWTFLYFDIDEAKLMLDTDIFYEYINERVNYLSDHTKKEATELCKNYFNGWSGTKLHIYDINEDTPCGEYWFEAEY